MFFGAGLRQVRRRFLTFTERRTGGRSGRVRRSQRRRRAAQLGHRNAPRRRLGHQRLTSLHSPDSNNNNDNHGARSLAVHDVTFRLLLIDPPISAHLLFVWDDNDNHGARSLAVHDVTFRLLQIDPPINAHLLFVCVCVKCTRLHRVYPPPSSAARI